MQPLPTPAPVHAVKKGRGNHHSSTDCYRCGGKHLPNDCRFKYITCHFCKKTGHIAKVCRSKAKRGQRGSQASAGGRGNLRKMHQISEQDDVSETPETSYNLFHLEGRRSRAEPINVTVNVNGANIAMEIDTGVHYSLISKSTYHGTWSHGKPPLEPVTIPLQTYTGEKLRVLGSINVSVKYAYKISSRSYHCWSSPNLDQA